jgi:hypothetical protein
LQRLTNAPEQLPERLLGFGSPGKVIEYPGKVIEYPNKVIERLTFTYKVQREVYGRSGKCRIG